MSQAEPTRTLSLSRYTPDAKALVAGAQALADSRRHVEVEPLHLLARGLSHDAGVLEVFRRAVSRPLDFQSAVDRALDQIKISREQAFLSDAMLDLLERAEREADRERSEQVTTEHLLNALSQEIRGAAGEIFGAFGIAPGSLRGHLSAMHAVPRAQGKRQVVELGAFARDWVEEARSGAIDPTIARTVEQTRLITILERRQRNHPLLVGEPGVGKRAVIAGLARRLAEGEVPAGLARTRLLEVNTSALVVGARLRGEVEERLSKLLAEASSEGDVVLVFPNLEQLLGQGPWGSGTAELLSRVLAQGKVQVLGTTTPEGVRRIEDRDPILLRSFTRLNIDEPSEADAIEILRGVAFRYEDHHEVSVGDEALEAAVRLAKRYARDRFLPDSAIDLLDETLAKKRVESDSAGSGRPQAERPRVQAADVAAVLTLRTGIPASRLLQGEADKLLHLEGRLEERVVGQPDAVNAVARAVRRGRVGLRDAKKPIGSFLFLGPSGVGKTELAKALAQLLFDDERALTRLDMSEFMERHMAQRLIGAPPGYADSEQGGFLTEAVRRRPYSVLLFDEVEKAHQDVFNLLLQVLDDGRLTDGRGRSADFSNTVVIMTSNIGSERILDTDAHLFESEEGREALRDVLIDQLSKFFRPEFLNRVDDVIVFRPLTRAHLQAILEMQLAELSRLLAPRQLELQITDEVKRALVEQGYDPALGARPLKRVLLQKLQDPLAYAIVQGGYQEGDTVRVSLKQGELAFDATKPS